ncbi:MAG: oligosaccharide flippase family protein, partial [Rickettsia endosymbiont of Ixodes persulcatus]|nr:oligosaccharide flippase family protein [Rickettsia endosymbiont of Ixodes persulcatus]
MVNELIHNKSEQGIYLGTSIVLRIWSGLLSIFAILILLSILNAGQELLIVVAMVQSVILLFQALHILDFWFQSKLRSKYVSIAKIFASSVAASYSAYLLLSGKDLVWFAASTSISALIISLILLFFYYRQGGEKLRFSLASAKYLLGKSHHFIIANIIVLVYLQIDKVMIGNMINTTQLGLYSAALILCTAWTFLPDSIITSMRPGIIEAKQESEVKYLRRLKQLYFILFWLSVGVSLLITLAAPYL